MSPISIWHSKNNPYIAKLSPDFPVYTMRMTWEEYRGDINQLCDQCFLNTGDRSQHFWWREKRLGRVELEKIDAIPFYAYMKMHFEEIRGMNSFWDLGRLDFISKWQHVWKDELEQYQILTQA